MEDNANDIILPRTRSRRKGKIKEENIEHVTKDTHVYTEKNLEKMLKNLPKTDEQKKIENNQWSWETKIWIVLAITIIIIVLLMTLYVLWSKDYTSSNKQNILPGSETNNIPSHINRQYMQKYQQEQLQRQQERQHMQYMQNLQQQSAEQSAEQSSANTLSVASVELNSKAMKLEQATKQDQNIIIDENLKNKVIKGMNKNSNYVDKNQGVSIEEKIQQVPDEIIDNPKVLEELNTSHAYEKKNQSMHRCII